MDLNQFDAITKREILKLFNDVVRPWEELNQFLLNPYAVDSDLSGINTRAGYLLISLSHYPETIGKTRIDSGDLKTINDVADSIKHGLLRNQARQSTISVSPLFEVTKEGLYGFRRNIVIAEHATTGKIDLMALALNGINYWLKNYQLVYPQPILENNPPDYFPSARLEYNPQYCLELMKISATFIMKDSTGKEVPVPDGQTVSIAVFQRGINIEQEDIIISESGIPE